MSKKLLLADDSITIQKVIQITFAHEDYELTITDNGDSAMAKALEIKPDLVMADVYMPGKNGYELASAIKQEPALQHVPVLLLAGSFEPFDEDKARSCKADAWIEKPFESQTLIDKVAELLSAAASVPQVAAPAVEPAAETAAAFDESPLAAFEQPFEAEPQMAAAMDDPFGDISFEDETPAAEPAAPAFADDWSDVALESSTEPVNDEAFTVAEEPALEVADDDRFAEVTAAPDEAFAAMAEEPFAQAGAETFDLGEEEIMPLGDDDILGAEDLEPLVEEQTLAAWSRDKSDEEDIFAAPVEEETAVEADVFAEPEMPVFAEDVPAFATADSVFAAEPAVFAADEPAFVEPPAVEEAPEFAEAAAAELPAEEPAVVYAATEPTAVEAKASAMSDAEIEQIIEKVVTKVVEKLAGSILEKVAWEVVPDLAENLIRQEIRKIKDAAA